MSMDDTNETAAAADQAPTSGHNDTVATTESHSAPQPSPAPETALATTSPEPAADDPSAGSDQPADSGARGMALPDTGEIAGGNIVTELYPPEDTQTPEHAFALQRRAARSSFFQQLMALSGRPVSAMGLLGRGDVVKGHMILIDVESGEKVRAYDGARITDDRVFCNARNVPEALSQGDVRANIGG